MRKKTIKGRPLFQTRWQEGKKSWRRAPGLTDALQVICPDKWKDGSNNNTEGGGRKVNENKALSKKKRYTANLAVARLAASTTLVLSFKAQPTTGAAQVAAICNKVQNLQEQSAPRCTILPNMRILERRVCYVWQADPRHLPVSSEEYCPPLQSQAL